MTSQNDTQNRPHEQDNEAGQPVSRRRLKAFIKRLERNPPLLAQFEAIAAIADAGGDAGTQSADEIESRILEATRKLGRRTLTDWAEAAQERAIEDCKKEHPGARLKKKRH